MDQAYKSVIEALIFASDEPIKAVELIKAIKEIDGEETEITTMDVENAVAELNLGYKLNDGAFSILKIANGFAFATGMEYAKYLGYLSNEKSKRRLSQAALETLAIVAYKQPVTKPDIETIRGVNSDYMINTLLEKNLINIQGRSETIGRPLLYGTTDEFLKYFGINNLSDLPKPREIEEIMKDEDFLEQKRKILMNALEESITQDEDENGTEEE